MAQLAKRTLSGVRSIFRLEKRKALKWSAIALLSIWGGTEVLFRTDPISYVRYPIRQVDEFHAFSFGLDRPSRFQRRQREETYSALRSLSFTPDGQAVYLQQSPHILSIRRQVSSALKWDAHSGEAESIFDYEQHPFGEMETFATSEDFTRFITSDNTPSVQVRSAVTGEVLPVLQGANAVMESAVLSADGEMVAGIQTNESGRSQVNIWNVQTGERQQSLEVLPDVQKIAFSPDNRLLALSSPTTLTVWTLTADKKNQFSLLPAQAPIKNNGNNEAVVALHFSTDSQTLSVQKNDCQLEQIDLSEIGSESIERVRTVESRQYAMNRISAISSDRKLMACLVAEYGDEGRTVSDHLILIDTSTGEEKVVLEDVGILFQVAFSPDSQTLAVASSAGDVRLHSLDSDDVVAIEDYGHGGFAYQADGKALIGINSRGGVAVFDPTNGRKIRTVIPDNDINSGDIGVHPSLSADAEILVTQGQSVMALWSRANEKVQLDHIVPVRSPARLTHLKVSSLIKDASTSTRRFAATGSNIYIGRDRSLNLQRASLVIGDFEADQIIRVIHGDADIHDVVFSADGEAIATIHTDNTAAIRDSATGSLSHRLNLANRSNLTTRQPVETEIGRVAFSSDGKRLVTSNETAIQVWNAQTGELIHTLREGTNGISLSGALRLDGDFAISPDGRWIAASKPPVTYLNPRDNRIYLWNAQTGQLARTFVPHTLNASRATTIRGLAFSPDSTTLAAGDGQNRITIWEIPNQL